MTDRPVVKGVTLDPQTRCIHWHSPLDVVAIKMACCLTYYACNDCHEALAGHPARTWPRTAWNEPAVLCGVCGHQLSVAEYLRCDSTCPACGAAFNPGCRNHHHLYFDA